MSLNVLREVVASVG